MENNKERWDKAWSDNKTRWDIGYPAPPIKEYFDQVVNKDLKILIPGAGNAYEAEYLFKSGFKNVFVLDWSDIPLMNLKERVEDFPDDRLICGDFFSHKEKYNVVIEHVFFCAIEPALRVNYAKKVDELLMQGGKLVGLLINDKMDNIEREEPGPPYGGTKEEYLKYFKPYFNVKTYETANNSIPPRSGRELFINFVKK